MHYKMLIIYLPVRLTQRALLRQLLAGYLFIVGKKTCTLACLYFDVLVQPSPHNSRIASLGDLNEALLTSSTRPVAKFVKINNNN